MAQREAGMLLKANVFPSEKVMKNSKMVLKIKQQKSPIEIWDAEDRIGSTI